ncbi:MAG: PilZ domain-containing protein, partial [Spirochaetaceae bacterium]
RSLSAGGAFLEHRDPMPEPGTEIELIVHFHGSSFVSHCRVLERRMASSNLPPGQGLAFTALSEYARRILDQLVGDALVRALTEPDPEPSVPTIGEEEFELSLAPEFDPN